MTSLILIAQEYREAAAKLSDLDLDAQTVADTLEGLGGEFEAKALSVAHVIRTLEADKAAMLEWAKNATAAANSAGNRAEELRKYLHMCMDATGRDKVVGPGGSIGFRASSAVVIDAPELIPLEFMRQPEPPPPAPDKKAIGDALKAGKEVSGAHIEHRKNLQIK